jgi:hypothetical protein
MTSEAGWRIVPSVGVILVHGIPAQREPHGAGSPLPFERGTCGSDVVHAVRKTLNGLRAACDATVPLVRLGGRFELSAADSCHACVATIEQRQIRRVPAPAP